MDCSACGHPNPAGARFCGDCAAPLGGSSECPGCGASNPRGQRFCNHCARRLPGATEPAPSPDEGPRAFREAPEGERKQVTVLFGDIVGSQELAERTDPEAWRGVIDRFFSILSAGIDRFEGTVDKFTGDGIMAIFGAPVSQEDHAQRACHAALHLQHELATYGAELRREQDLDLSVRIGLNSGEVVVGPIGEQGRMAYTAIGHTVGLAQRVEQLCARDRITLSEHTAALVEGYFALSARGPVAVKGAREPLRIYELTGVGAARGSLDVARSRGLTRFVGREAELETLDRVVERALAGDGQLVGIVGEAGVGKSRLCYELAERQRAKGIPVYHLTGQAHARSVPLMPVLRFLRSYFGITDGDLERTARERIAAKLLSLDQGFDEELPLMFDFLAVPDPRRPVERMDPEARQRRLLELVKKISRAQSAREPGVMVIEDLQWLDSASELFLTSLVEAIPGTGGLIVVNFRPGYRAPWMSRSYYRQIALSPLAPEVVETLLAEVLGADPSIAGVADLVRERTQGNPFFVEELVRSLVEAGTLEGARGAYRLVRPVTEATVPATVQAVLAARIDRLPAREKAVLQAAAVIGKELPAPLLARVVELDPQQLQGALHELVVGEFVYERELDQEATYVFKHPLTHEVAYGSQLSQGRATVHAAAAQAIAERYPEQLDERAALIAQHWEAAGEELEAANWHARAAAWAGYNDPAEALRHWRKVGELTDALPESAETATLRLTARVSSLQFGWRLGISDDEAETLFRDAERIASAAGNVHARALLLGGYGAIAAVGQGEVGRYAELARRALTLAEQSGDPALYIAMGTNAYAFFLTGECREGLAILDRAIELAAGDPTVAAGMPVACPYAFCHGLKGLLLTYLGELQAADQALEQGRTLAREHGDIETVGFNHIFSTWLASAVGERDAAVDHAQRAVEIAERIGGALARAWAWGALAMAEQERGEWRQAIEASERSLEIARERRTAREADGVRLANLAESYLGLGDQGRACTLAAQGLELTRERGTPFLEIHASLTRARVLLGSAGAAAREEIESALARVVELERGMGTRAFAPAVHVELAELARQGGDERARERELREAHRLFTAIGATGHAGRLAGELAAVAG